MAELEKIQIPLPKVEFNDDLIVKNVPNYKGGDMIFEPLKVYFVKNKENPFYKGGKPVEYYIAPETTPSNRIKKSLLALFDKYPDLKTPENLKLPLGSFASKLKTNTKLTVGKGKKEKVAYKTLVNSFGDEEEYVKMNIENITRQVGLYIWVIDNKPKYIGIASSEGGLHKRLHSEYSNITTYQCSINGNDQTCRTNSRVRDAFNANSEVSVYVCPINTEEYINDPEFIKALNANGVDKEKYIASNVLGYFESYIINSGGFIEKEGGWNRSPGRKINEMVKKIISNKKLKLPSNN